MKEAVQTRIWLPPRVLKAVLLAAKGYSNRSLDLLFSKDIVQFSHESSNQYVSYTRQGQDRSAESRERQPSRSEDAA